MISRESTWGITLVEKAGSATLSGDSPEGKAIYIGGGLFLLIVIIILLILVF
jgi:hypothetical protein